MSDIAAFLLARIAEDEQAIRLAGGEAPRWGTFDNVIDCDCGEDHAYSSYLAVDPARLLAECEAKRRIIELHGPEASVMWLGTFPCRTCSYDGDEETNWVNTPCPTLCALAAPYAAHPDFDAAWLGAGQEKP